MLIKKFLNRWLPSLVEQNTNKYTVTVTVTVTRATIYKDHTHRDVRMLRAVACGPGRRSTSVMLGHACEMLAVMYLQRGPPIAENESTPHRTHRTHRSPVVTVCLLRGDKPPAALGGSCGLTHVSAPWAYLLQGPSTAGNKPPRICGK
jgi:hypothetical protein